MKKIGDTIERAEDCTREQKGEREQNPISQQKQRLIKSDPDLVIQERERTMGEDDEKRTGTTRRRCNECT